jgi:heptosyltransferase II
LESWWQPAEAEKTQRILSALSPAEQHVVLHLTSSNEAKQWPEMYALALAEWLLTQPGVQVHCLGAKSDEALYLQLRQNLPEPLRSKMHIHCGHLNLLESMAFLQRMTLVVGVDSGTLHMASAAGTPVVALFGPMDEHKWAPPNATVVTNPVECRPCNLSVPCRHDFRCMKDLRPETVIERIKTYDGFS